MIKFEQVGKRYANGHVGLHELSFHVRRGEFLFVTGHSGAGKSTLLRLLLAMERPSSGKLLLAGQDLSHITNAQIPFLRRQIGVVFQNHQLLFDRSVFDNVALPLQILGLSKDEIGTRVRTALERVSLADKAEQSPGDLSTGQQQRVGIARALATEPDILLCDEATSALDPQTTASVLQLLAEINAELKLTIVLITHEMDVIRRVCDRVAVMDGGEIVEQGPVTEVFLHPKHPTTQRFVLEDEAVDEGEQHDDFAHVPGRILRLTFQGEATYKPLLGTVARETGVDFSILSGRIDRIKDTPYGQLTLALVGGDMGAALAQLDAADVHVEVLR